MNIDRELEQEHSKPAVSKTCAESSKLAVSFSVEFEHQEFFMCSSCVHVLVRESTSGSGFQIEHFFLSRVKPEKQLGTLEQLSSQAGPMEA